ncbi:transcription initiation factor TFIID subunit 4-like [Bos javanicus]|uniref:transcription initiation factor TFIID subunit 4-like n=1 Tax=Bos javanicus TaxID=9906 RepID=UPI002AA6F053|nr:transcription initiation factor TFIID subunit 4-like [Bos javanicus]
MPRGPRGAAGRSWGPRPGVRRALRPRAAAGRASPAAGSSAPLQGLGRGVRPPAAARLLHGPAPRPGPALAWAAALLLPAASGDRPLCAAGRPALGSPGPGLAKEGRGGGGAPGRGPGSAETRGSPARAPLARTPRSRRKPVRLAGPLPPDAPPDDTARSPLAAAASLPAGVSEQAAPRLLHVPAEPGIIRQSRAGSETRNPCSGARHREVVETAFTVFSSSFSSRFSSPAPPPPAPSLDSHSHAHAHDAPQQGPHSGGASSLPTWVPRAPRPTLDPARRGFRSSRMGMPEPRATARGGLGARCHPDRSAKGPPGPENKATGLTWSQSLRPAPAKPRVPS